MPDRKDKNSKGRDENLPEFDPNPTETNNLVDNLSEDIQKKFSKIEPGSTSWYEEMSKLRGPVTGKGKILGNLQIDLDRLDYNESFYEKEEVDEIDIESFSINGSEVDEDSIINETEALAKEIEAEGDLLKVLEDEEKLHNDLSKWENLSPTSRGLIHSYMLSEDLDPEEAEAWESPGVLNAINISNRMEEIAGEDEVWQEYQDSLDEYKDAKIYKPFRGIYTISKLIWKGGLAGYGYFGDIGTTKEDQDEYNALNREYKKYKEPAVRARMEDVQKRLEDLDGTFKMTEEGELIGTIGVTPQTTSDTRIDDLKRMYTNQLEVMQGFLDSDEASIGEEIWSGLRDSNLNSLAELRTSMTVLGIATEEAMGKEKTPISEAFLEAYASKLEFENTIEPVISEGRKLYQATQTTAHSLEMSAGLGAFRGGTKVAGRVADRVTKRLANKTFREFTEGGMERTIKGAVGKTSNRLLKKTIVGVGKTGYKVGEIGAAVLTRPFGMPGMYMASQDSRYGNARTFIDPITGEPSAVLTEIDKKELINSYKDVLILTDKELRNLEGIDNPTEDNLKDIRGLQVLKKDITEQVDDFYTNEYDSEGNTVGRHIPEDWNWTQSFWYGYSEKAKEVLTEEFAINLLRGGKNFLNYSGDVSGVNKALNSLGNTKQLRIAKIAAAKARRKISDSWVGSIPKTPGQVTRKIVEGRLGSGKGLFRTIHSLPIEVFEEVYEQVIPTYGEDYREQISELSQLSWYTDVVVTMLAMKSVHKAPSAFKRQSAIFKYGDISPLKRYTKEGKEKYEKAKQAVKDKEQSYEDEIKNMKDLYSKMDVAETDEDLAKAVAMKSADNLYSHVEYEIAIAKLENEGNTEEAAKLRERSYLNQGIMALKTGTMKDFKDNLRNVLFDDSFSEGTRESAQHVLDRMRTIENTAEAHGDKANYNTILNLKIRDVLATQTIKDAQATLQSLYEEKGEDGKSEIANIIEAVKLELDLDSVQIGFTIDNMVDKSMGKITLNEPYQDLYQDFMGKLIDYLEGTPTTAIEMDERGILKTYIGLIAQVDGYTQQLEASKEQYKYEISQKGQELAEKNKKEEIKKFFMESVNKDNVAEKKAQAKEIFPEENLNNDIDKKVNEEGKTGSKIKSNKESSKVAKEESSIHDEGVNSAMNDAMSESEIAQPEVKETTQETSIKEETEKVSDQAVTLEDEELIFSPISYNPSNDKQNNRVDAYSNWMKKQIDKNSSTDFAALLYDLKEGYGRDAINREFELLTQAWDRAKGTQMSRDQKDRAFSEFFGSDGQSALDADLQEAMSEIGEDTDTQVTSKSLGDSSAVVKKGEETTEEERSEINKEVEAPEKLVGVNPKTGEVGTKYEGFKPLSGAIRASFLGLNYDVVGESLVTKTNQVNETAFPALHWDNFKVGSSYDLTFNIGYLIAENEAGEQGGMPLRRWVEVDSDNPISIDTTVKGYIEHIFGEGQYESILDQIGTEESRKEFFEEVVTALEKESESKEAFEKSYLETLSEADRKRIENKLELLKMLPTSFEVGDMKTDVGISNHDWWNAQNIALVTPQQRSQSILEGRDNNLATRLKLVQDGIATMEVNKHTLGFQNTLILETDKEKEQGYSDKFQSTIDAYKGDREASNRYSSVGFIKGEGLVNNTMLDSQGKMRDVLTINGKTVSPDQITNLDAFKKRLAKDSKGYNGRPAFIYQVGERVNKAGNLVPVYSMETALNNHAFLRGEGEHNSPGDTGILARSRAVLYDVFANYANVYSGAVAGDKATSKKVVDYVKSLGGDISNYNNFLQNFKDYYFKGNYYDRMDLSSNLADTDYGKNMIDLFTIVSDPTLLTRGDAVEAVINIIENEGIEGLPTTDYLTHIKHHFNTQKVFSEIESEGKESVWTSTVQPTIEFTKGHLEGSQTPSDVDSSFEDSLESEILILENNIARYEIALREEDNTIERANLQRKINEFKKKIGDLQEKKVKDTSNLSEIEIEENSLIESEKVILELNTELEGELEGLNTKYSDEKSRDLARQALIEEYDKKSEDARDGKSKEEVDTLYKKHFRETSEHDIEDINNEVLFRAFQLLDLDDTVTKGTINESLAEAYSDFEEQIEKRGNPNEVQFLKDNRMNILGLRDEYGVINYDGSVREVLDTILDLKAEEDLSEEAFFEKDRAKSSFENDVSKSLSSKVKILLSGLKDTRVDSTGFGGVGKFLAFKDSVNALQQVMTNIENNTPEKLIEALREKAKGNLVEFGFYTEIADRLEKLYKDDSKLINQILYSLYQPEVNMYFIMFKKMSNGKFIVQRYNANSRHPDILKKSKWNEGQRVTDIFKKYEEGFYKVDENLAATATEQYNTLQTQKIEGNIDTDLVESFLGNFGITLAEGTMRALQTGEFGDVDMALYNSERFQDDQGNWVETGNMRGILAENRLVDLLHNNLVMALDYQRFGSLMKKAPKFQGELDNAKAKAFLTEKYGKKGGDKFAKIEGNSKKAKEDRLDIFRNLTVAGEIDVEGIELSFDQKFLEDETTQMNLNPLTNDTTGALKSLVKADNEMEFIPQSTNRIAGKEINNYEQSYFLSNTAKDLKRSSDYRKNILSTPVNSTSFWINMLETNPDMRDHFQSVLTSLEALKDYDSKSRDDMGMTSLSKRDYTIASLGMFTQNDGKISNPTLKKDGINLRKGSMNSATMSDASKVPIIMTALLDLNFGNFQTQEMDKLSDSMLDFMINNLIEGDLKRIGQQISIPERRVAKILNDINSTFTSRGIDMVKIFEETKSEGLDVFIERNQDQFTTEQLNEIKEAANKLNVNVRGFNAGAEFITSMASMNSLLVEVRDSNNNIIKRPLTEAFMYYAAENGESYRYNVSKFLTDYQSVIRAEMQRNVDQEVEEFITKDGKGGTLVSQGIFKDGELKFIDDKYLTDKLGEKYFENKVKKGEDGLKEARLLAHDYVINNFIFQKEFHNLFAGDIASYFYDSMGSDFEFGLPKVYLQDIADSFYEGDFSKEDIKEILANPDIESLRETNPEFLAATELAEMETIEERIETIHPIAQMKIEELFKDVHNNLSKRLKGPISPGSQFPGSQEGIAYKQIMLADNINASDIILERVGDIYPELYDKNKDKILDFKRIDNIYKSDRSVEQQDKHEAYLKEFKGKFPEIYPYFEIEGTDAQEYVTWKDHIHQLLQQGRLNNTEYQAIFKKLNAQSQDLIDTGYISETNQWKDSEKSLRALAMMQPSKPLYFGVHVENVEGVDPSEGFKNTRAIYIKSASFPLFPELTSSFGKMEAFRRNMETLEETGSDNIPITVARASYDSANKIGAVKDAISMSEMYGETVDADLLANSTVDLDRKNFFIQQDKTHDPDKDYNNRATQFEKIILGDGISKMSDNVKDRIFPNMFDSNILEGLGIDPNGKLTGKELSDVYKDIYKREQEIYKRDLFRQFGITGYQDIADGNVQAMERIADLLNQRLDNKQDKEAVQLLYTVDKKLDSGNTIQIQATKRDVVDNDYQPQKAMFRLPLYMMPNSQSIESILNSVINKNSVRLKTPGFSAIVASQEGFDYKEYGEDTSIEELYIKGLITTEGFDPIKGLQARRIDKDGNIYSEVFLPNKYKVLNQDTGEMEFIDLKQYVNEETKQIDPALLPNELIEMFSFRIPTSSHQSGVNIRVAGFLPQDSGDLMIVPKDFTIQIGEDYDVDVRYVYKNHYIKSGKGLKKFEFEDLPKKPEATYKEIRDSYKESLTEAFDKYYTKGEDGKTNLINPFWKANQEKLSDITILDMYLDKLKGIETAGDISIDLRAKTLSIMYPDLGNIQESSQYDEVDSIISMSSIQEEIDYLTNTIFTRDVLRKKSTEMKEEFKGIKDHLKNEFQYNTDLVESYNNYVGSVEYDQDSKKLLENNLVSMYKSVFMTSDPRVQNVINKVLSTENARRTAEDMDNKISGGNTSGIYNIYSASRQAEIMEAGSSGKVGIGEHSNAVTMNSIFQQAEREYSIDKSVFFNEEGDLVRIPYSIQLGNLTFDGVMGRIDRDGVSISELGMESQNVSTDNQKLAIMDKRNENPRTMAVLKILQANGIDRDGVKVNGKDYSYSSLFLNQPILREYAELVDRYNSTTDATFGSPLDLAEADLLKKYGEGIDKYWKIDGEGNVLVGELSNEAKETFGANLTSQELWDNLRQEDAKNIYQWYTFEAFKDLRSAATEYGKLQQFVNIEKDGMGISYFDTIELRDDLFDIMTDYTSRIEAQNELIGLSKSFKSSQLELLESQRDMYDSYIKDGYIDIGYREGNTLLVKPTSHFGHKIVNSIESGYNMFNSLFPFDHETIKNQIDTIVYTSGVNLGTKAEKELKYKIMSEMKDYMYSNNRTLFGANIDNVVNDIFFDSEGHDSLASYMMKMRDSGNYNNMFRSPFFKDLIFETNAGTYPSLIKFNNSDISSINSLYIYNMLSKYVDSDIELEKRNGEVYTEANLMKDLLNYTLLADQGNGAIGFRKHLPMSLMDKYNVTSTMRRLTDASSPDIQNIAFNGLYKSLEQFLGSEISEDGVINNVNIDNYSEEDRGEFLRDLNYYVLRINSVLKDRTGENNTVQLQGENVLISNYEGGDIHSNFVKQFIQHNPEEAKKLGRTYQTPDKYGMGLVTRASGLLESILKENGYKTTQVPKIESFRLEEDIQPFVTLEDTKGKLYLFERKTEGFYQRIPMLGVVGFNEYKAGLDIKESRVKKNNYEERGLNPLSIEQVKNQFGMGQLKDLLHDIAVDENSQYSAVVQLFRPLVNLDGVEITVDSSIDGKGKAAYSPSEKMIRISESYLDSSPSKTELQGVIVEEFLHHATIGAIRKYGSFTNISDDLKVQFVAKEGVTVPKEVYSLSIVYNKALEVIAEKQGKEALLTKIRGIRSRIEGEDPNARLEGGDSAIEAYRLSSIDEFLAGVFIKDESFAKIMASTKYANTNKSLLVKFIEELSDLFYRLFPGFRKETLSSEVAVQLSTLLKKEYAMKPEAEVSRDSQEQAKYEKQQKTWERARNFLEGRSATIGNGLDTIVQNYYEEEFLEGEPIVKVNEDGSYSVVNVISEGVNNTSQARGVNVEHFNSPFKSNISKSEADLRDKILVSSEKEFSLTRAWLSKEGLNSSELSTRQKDILSQSKFVEQRAWILSEIESGKMDSASFYDVSGGIMGGLLSTLVEDAKTGESKGGIEVTKKATTTTEMDLETPFSPLSDSQYNIGSIAEDIVLSKLPTFVDVTKDC